MIWAGIILPPIIAVVGFVWVPLHVWADMNSGLLAFLGLLAAALIQVIPVTANFVQSDSLTPFEAEHLSKQLTKQQRYWLGLLAVTIATTVLVILTSVLRDAKPLVILSDQNIDVAQALSGLVSASMTFLIFKMVGLFQGVLSLQRLRNDLVIAAAKRGAAEKAEVAQHKANLPTNIVPESYGKIIRPH